MKITACHGTRKTACFLLAVFYFRLRHHGISIHPCGGEQETTTHAEHGNSSAACSHKVQRSTETGVCWWPHECAEPARTSYWRLERGRPTNLPTVFGAALVKDPNYWDGQRFHNGMAMLGGHHELSWPGRGALFSNRLSRPAFVYPHVVCRAHVRYCSMSVSCDGRVYTFKACPLARSFPTSLPSHPGKVCYLQA